MIKIDGSAKLLAEEDRRAAQEAEKEREVEEKRGKQEARERNPC